MGSKQILFIHGGGEDGFKADTLLADSLRQKLAGSYEVLNPQLQSNDTDPDFGWLNQIGQGISSVGNEIILVGHSLGASMLLKYLSENRVQKNIIGLFLIAPPYWSGDEDWKQGIKLHEDFADAIPKDIPIFIYQCLDDEEVPFDHFTTYQQHLPWATFREVESGGHQFNNDLTLVAQDIKSL